MLHRANGHSDYSSLVGLLNQVLKLEYSLIVNYPRLARQIRDETTRELVISLGVASVGHANEVAKALSKLGGTPRWSFEGMAEDLNVVKTVERQLDKEKSALRLHRECAALAGNTEFEEVFMGLAEEEKSHIKTVEKILAALREVPVTLAS